MIPKRIELSGFLSYKETQEVLFEGASLWMLSGKNGSGKSSIFDAVTYALFGHHRGGGQNAGELINKESNQLEVVFDFLLGEGHFRIRRTLKRSPTGRTSGTQQVYRQATSGGVAEWQPVPDTTNKGDFDKWVRDEIGLSYDTFTSSVLLLQGRAERLLDATPAGRANVLASIVDLHRYQKLHERAVANHREWKSKVELLGQQTAILPEVSEQDLKQAELKVEEAAREREQRQKGLEATVEQIHQAERRQEAVAKVRLAEQKVTAAERLITNAVRIEKQYARFQELKAVLPQVEAVIIGHTKISESQKRTEHFQHQRAEARKRQAVAESQLAKVKEQRQLLGETLRRDEAELSQASQRLRQLTKIMETLRIHADTRAQLATVQEQIGTLPDDTDTAHKQAVAELERLQVLSQALGTVERLRLTAQQWLAEREASQAAEQSQNATRDRGNKLREQVESVKRQLEKSRDEKAAAERQKAIAGSALELAEQAVAALETLGDLPDCRLCGQPLTPDHLAKERTKRQTELTTAKRKSEEAARQFQAVADREHKLSTEASQLDHQLAQLREDYIQERAKFKQHCDQTEQLEKNFSSFSHDLPEPIRKRFPARLQAEGAESLLANLESLLAEQKSQVADLDSARGRVQKAQSDYTQWLKLTERRKQLEASLEALASQLPQGQTDEARTEYERLNSQELALKESIASTRKAQLLAESEERKQSEEQGQAVRELTMLQGKLEAETNTRQLLEETNERAIRQLAPEWAAKVLAAGLADLHSWKRELDDLVADNVEGQNRQLDQARAGVATLREQLAEQQKAADQFPPEASRPLDELRSELADSRKALDHAERQWQDARIAHKTMIDQQSRRKQLGEEWAVANREMARSKLLAELLGRDRLQRHLLRQAERQIVDLANAALDRLSGGELFLKLVGDEEAGADRALDLECHNRITGSSPIGVAFLSGSQRFRVAVSLALGIGQYASKRHSPIESVIIDEGFGCLDREGRSVMIQELQNLRGQLRCVVLVSHQEEFAEAFPDGYLFALQEGKTVVSRFAKNVQ